MVNDSGLLLRDRRRAALVPWSCLSQSEIVICASGEPSNVGLVPSSDHPRPRRSGVKRVLLGIRRLRVSSSDLAPRAPAEPSHWDGAASARISSYTCLEGGDLRCAKSDNRNTWSKPSGRLVERVPQCYGFTRTD